MSYRFNLLAISALVFSGASQMAGAAESYDNCTGFIDSVPTTITTQGTWCLRHDLSTAITNGNAITVGTSNVTVDCNGFKIGGLAAGTSTTTRGVSATDRLNVTVRHCNIRGFSMGVELISFANGGNYTVERNRIESSRTIGIRVAGDGTVVRSNIVRDTGGSTIFAAEAHGIHTYGAVDVLDNTVHGVNGDVGVYGIYTISNPSGSISGNRVRGITQTGVGEASGIYNYGSGRINLRDNDVNGDGTIGLYCFNGNGRARGNVINGFDVGVWSCSETGGNDITLRQTP